MSNVIDGTVQYEGQVQNVSNTFRKKTIIIKTFGQYPEMVQLELVQANADLSVPVGTVAKFHFNLKGSKEIKADRNGTPVAWTSIQCWKIEPIGAQAPAPSQFQQPPVAGQPAQQAYTPPQPPQPTQQQPAGWMDQQHANQQAQFQQGYNAGPNVAPPTTAQAYPPPPPKDDLPFN